MLESIFDIFKVIDKKQKEIKNFNPKNIPKLRYGMIHCRFGDPEGVSIVMKQIEDVLNKNLKIPKKNIFYLIGKSKTKSSRITENEILYDSNKVNRLMQDNYLVGYGGEDSEKIEIAINEAKKIIEDWVKKNKIDVLVAHNSSHPVNFVSSVALSRYYRDAIKKGEKTPKYILWWHDSHLERPHFLNPAKDVENYLLQGVPGPLVEYIIFINSTQFKYAKKYYKILDKKNPGFYNNMRTNHDVIYNTTDTFINKFRDLTSDKFDQKVDQFITDFKIRDDLKKRNLQLSDVLFVLQHTRMVDRKRIDFALRYSYELLKKLKEKGYYKSIYFLISGHRADKTKKELVKLNRQLIKEYNTNKLLMVFAEDYYNKTDITFEEYPKIFAKLKGISTYFSAIEGFGNNLLEVLASGLIPVIYTYPVFKSDIAKYKFKVIALDKFEVSEKKIEDTIKIIRNKTERRKWVNANLRILKKHFAHETMAVNLIQAITSPRLHK